MIRAALIATPLVLAAGIASAQDGHAHHQPQPAPQTTVATPVDPHVGHTMPTQAADPHAGHTMPTQAADPHAGHVMPVQVVDPHAGHAMPTQAADPHAGHVMPTQTADPHAGHVMPVQVVDPHAGHAMPTQTADPHAGHVMPVQVVDPHAGHAMPTQAADPHAGHVMPTQTADPHAGHMMPTQTADPHAGHVMPVQVVDPHAGHAMPAQAADPHAGHAMPTQAADPHAGHSMPVPRVDPPVAGPSVAARSGPAHAADLYFDPADMARSRAVIAYENGAMPTTALFVDRLEYSAGEGPDHGSWEVQGWTGGDIHRLWLKTDGAFDFDDGVDEAGVELLYSRAIAPFWDVQAGVRQDYSRDGSDPTSVVLALQGVAPHWWETSGSLYVSTKGDVTAELEAEYDQRITQKLILQPVLGLSLSAQNVPERALGSGLTSVEAGLRLRYEIRKEFAPYIGVEWSQAFGQTRDWREAAGQDASDTRFVVGIKAWL